MVFPAADAATAVSFQQFPQNTTSYCDVSYSPLECSNLSMMEEDNSRCRISQSPDETRGVGGQKCDFLLGAQQAEAETAGRGGGRVQVVEHDAGSQQHPISALGMKYARSSDPSPKLSSPDACMQAFGLEERGEIIRG